MHDSPNVLNIQDSDSACNLCAPCKCPVHAWKVKLMYIQCLVTSMVMCNCCLVVVLRSHAEVVFRGWEAACPTNKMLVVLYASSWKDCGVPTVGAAGK